MYNVGSAEYRILYDPNGNPDTTYAPSAADTTDVTGVRPSPSAAKNSTNAPAIGAESPAYRTMPSIDVSSTAHAAEEPGLRRRRRPWPRWRLQRGCDARGRLRLNR